MMIPRLFAIDGVLLGTMLVGSVMWDSYQQQTAMQYQQWHAQTYRSSDCGNGTGGDDKKDCDVGISNEGDCSCGGSDGGGCGGED